MKRSYKYLTVREMPTGVSCPSGFASPELRKGASRRAPGQLKNKK